MTPTTYRVLCAYAGPALSRPHPWPVPASRPFPLQIRSAVYVIEDGDGRCCYVGSVNRRAGGLAEHLDNPAKRSVWHHVWVVPLISPIAEVEVRRIEGVIGAHLGPYLSRRLPFPLPSSSRSVRAVSRP